MLFDRMYGQIKFPEYITPILNCPGLMRLREVRMANIPFLSFPSFSAVNRYEHSIGVCFLAYMVAKQHKLPERDAAELMLAGLYHDVATPPFGHAVEKVLRDNFNFDHEKKLQSLISGEKSSLGGQSVQVFAGRSIKLCRYCNSSIGRKLNLDLYRIARIAAGDPNEPLSALISSDDIDIDNIDNVVRAATSMGIVSCDTRLPLEVVGAFVLDDGKIGLCEASRKYIVEWQQLRHKLYTSIFASIDDTAQQVMLEDALSCPELNFSEEDWCLTDIELMRKLLAHGSTKHIINRMRLGDVYSCLAYFHISSLKQIDCKAVTQVSQQLAIEYENNATTNIFVHCNPDKRIRSIVKSSSFIGKLFPGERVGRSSSAYFVGLFTSKKKKWSPAISVQFVKELKNILPAEYDVSVVRINEDDCTIVIDDDHIEKQTSQLLLDI